jgi:hypothetical protein
MVGNAKQIKKKSNINTKTQREGGVTEKIIPWIGYWQERSRSRVCRTSWLFFLMGFYWFGVLVLLLLLLSLLLFLHFWQMHITGCELMDDQLHT